jgi:hypothetical protein
VSTGDNYSDASNFASTSATTLDSTSPTSSNQTSTTSTTAPSEGLDDKKEELEEPTLLTALTDLFKHISSQPKKEGTVEPKEFINQLRKENELFRSTMHQDAHGNAP